MGKKYRMRKPKVENKYNLDFENVYELVVNREELENHLNLFWRNNVVKAYCISKTCGYAYFWFGIYDNNTFEIKLTVWEDMCSYNPTQFFNPKEVECEDDLQIQEELLKALNELIDLNVLVRSDPNVQD